MLYDVAVLYDSNKLFLLLFYSTVCFYGAMRFTLSFFVDAMLNFSWYFSFNKTVFATLVSFLVARWYSESRLNKITMHKAV